MIPDPVSQSGTAGRRHIDEVTHYIMFYLSVSALHSLRCSVVEHRFSRGVFRSQLVFLSVYLVISALHSLTAQMLSQPWCVQVPARVSERLSRYICSSFTHSSDVVSAVVCSGPSSCLCPYEVCFLCFLSVFLISCSLPLWSRNTNTHKHTELLISAVNLQHIRYSC